MAKWASNFGKAISILNSLSPQINLINRLAIRFLSRISVLQNGTIISMA
jgi:hypothetical protein